MDVLQLLKSGTRRSSYYYYYGVLYGRSADWVLPQGVAAAGASAGPWRHQWRCAWRLLAAAAGSREPVSLKTMAAVSGVVA